MMLNAGLGVGPGSDRKNGRGQAHCVAFLDHSGHRTAVGAAAAVCGQVEFDE